MLILLVRYEVPLRVKIVPLRVKIVPHIISKYFLYNKKKWHERCPCSRSPFWRSTGNNVSEPLLKTSWPFIKKHLKENNWREICVAPSPPPPQKNRYSLDISFLSLDISRIYEGLCFFYFDETPESGRDSGQKKTLIQSPNPISSSNRIFVIQTSNPITSGRQIHVHSTCQILLI